MKKTKLNFKKSRKELLLFISLFLFLIITFLIFNNSIASLDASVHDYILSIRNDKLTSSMIIITNISSTYALIVISILLLTIIKNKKISFQIITNLVFVFLLSQLFKILIRRPRPTGISLIDTTGFSYPSGHSMVSMAYFGFIAYLIYKNLHNKIAKIILIITILCTITLIGFSRIYLGAHYLSDVIGGFLLSIAYLMVYIKQINRSPKRQI